MAKLILWKWKSVSNWWERANINNVWWNAHPTLTLFSVDLKLSKPDLRSIEQPWSWRKYALDIFLLLWLWINIRGLSWLIKWILKLTQLSYKWELELKQSLETHCPNLKKCTYSILWFSEWKRGGNKFSEKSNLIWIRIWPILQNWDQIVVDADTKRNYKP